MLKFFLAAFIVLQLACNAQVNLQYIANMGVLLSDGENAVLIDALHEEYKPAYLFPSSETVENLAEGTYTEASIQYILFTHLHKDHCSQKLAKQFLEKNENAKLVASQQAVAQLGGAYQSQLKGLEMGEFHKEMKEDLSVLAYACEHVNPKHVGVENLTFIVSFSGRNYMHVGDSNWDELLNCLTHKVAAGLEFEGIILPYWMYYDKQLSNKLKKLPASKKYYAAHLPPDFSEAQRLEQKLPGLILLQEPNKVYN